MKQKDFVLGELRKHGEISRNLCLQNRITRLGAIICDLNKDGWVIDGKFKKTEYGKDYVYKVREKKPEYTYKITEQNGNRVAQKVLV